MEQLTEVEFFNGSISEANYIGTFGLSSVPKRGDYISYPKELVYQVLAVIWMLGAPTRVCVIMQIAGTTI